MPQNFGELFSEDELNTLIAYILRCNANSVTRCSGVAG